jgi:membrane protease YdiL (CAAX protease family)
MKPRPWLPYVLPMALYMAFLFFQSNANLVWLYPLKTVAVAIALWWFRRQYTELRAYRPTELTPGPSGGGQTGLSAPLSGGVGGGLSLAIAVGLVAIAVWIVIDPLYPKLSQATPFDASGRHAFIVFRVIGAVLVVPVMEELFWRAFLIRWLVNPDFKSVPVGTFTWPSFLITVALFGAEHNEWLAGLICGALYNWVLYRTRSVLACVVAHATSNAALAAWVLGRSDWKFW